MSLSRVPGDDDLYIGGIFTLKRRAALQAANITHIVSVLRQDARDEPAGTPFQRCSVPVDDVEDENLLGEFARTTRFIRAGLEGGGGVLVHCAMGKSRSVAVVLAYLLATRPTRCPDVATALALVRETRPMAEPNAGFMAQLELFRTWGCPDDVEAEPAYQRWLYRQEVDQSLAIGRAPDRLRFEDEEDAVRGGDDVAASGPAAQSPSLERQKELRCRRCRRTLATAPYLIPHVPKADLTSSSPTSPPPPPPPCTHHFIQPLSWMRPTLSPGALAGRLECPQARCAQVVGRYAWQGLRCSCGHWVVPGFSLAAGKVDEFVPAGPGGGWGGGIGIRMPPSGGGGGGGSGLNKGSL